MLGKNVYQKKERTSSAHQCPAKITESAPTEFSMIDEQDCDFDLHQLISLYYLRILHVPPPEDWHGEGGTLSEICDRLNMQSDQR